MNKSLLSFLVTATALIPAVCSASTATQPLYVSPVIDQTSSSTTDTSTTGSSGSDSTIPPDHTSSTHQFLIGPEASVFFPTSSKTGNAYGKSWTSIGFGLGSAFQASAHGTLSPFFTILYNSHDGNRAFVLPLGVSYNKAISPSQNSAYYGGDILVIGADQRAVGYGVHSGFRYGEGLRPVVGYEFGHTAYIQASYLFATTIKGFDFSGSSIEAGIRF